MAKKIKKRGNTIKTKKTSSLTETMSVVKADFILNLIASIIVLIAGILFLVLPLNFAFFAFPKAVLFGILSIVMGLGMLIATVALRTNPREASVFILVFSLIVLIFPPHGFVVGPIIGIVDSILVLAKIRHH